jgi:hypothetical protein
MRIESLLQMGMRVWKRHERWYVRQIVFKSKEAYGRNGNVN